MCTVTFWPRRGGYRLAMNRDEQWTRVQSLPPGCGSVGGRQFVAPSEPAGGTWIGLRDDGAAFALVNWYSCPTSPAETLSSRGKVVPHLLEQAEARGPLPVLERLCSQGLRPFRAMGFFPQIAAAREWRWDGQTLSESAVPWEPRQWISSGKDEPMAEKVRSAEFTRRRRELGAGRLGWLRSLHGSHLPEQGAFSHCVHREDAGTVSYTEITATGRRASMYHRLGCPCLGGKGSWHRLAPQPSPSGSI